jgi:hypothetical protein
MVRVWADTALEEAESAWDTDATRWDARVVIPPPGDLALALGDVAEQARAVLDNLVAQRIGVAKLARLTGMSERTMRSNVLEGRVPREPARHRLLDAVSPTRDRSGQE